MENQNKQLKGSTYFLDVITSEVIVGYCKNSSTSEFKVILYVYYKTLLCGRQTASISLNEFVEKTALTKPTILKVLEGLLKGRVLYRFEKCTPFEYGINYLTLFGIEDLQEGQGFYHINKLTLKNTDVEMDIRLSYGKDYL